MPPGRPLGARTHTLNTYALRGMYVSSCPMHRCVHLRTITHRDVTAPGHVMQ